MRRLKARLYFPLLALTLTLFSTAVISGQGQPELPPPSNLVVAKGIPGVVAAGTPIQILKTGFEGAEGPVGMPDGSVLFTETRASRITRIDPDGKVSTFLNQSNESNGLGFDPEGRLISVQRAPGNQKVGVLYPRGREAVLADSYDGKPFNRLNDLVVDRKGGVYFSDSIGDNTGLYYIPPGGKAMSATSYGGDLRNLGAGSVERQRLRPDATIVPRNAFTQPGRNRTNVRIQQRLPLPRVSIDVMAEAFNVFNRPNWTINAQENNAQYLKAIAGENRTMQFGFRITF